MARRATNTEIQLIIDVDTSITDAMITAFGTSASVMVDNVFADDTTLDSTTLAEIEKYLAAHFISLRDPRATEERNEEVWVKYQGQTGKRIEATYYGQMALSLDTTGQLAKAGMKKASIGMIDYNTDVS